MASTNCNKCHIIWIVPLLLMLCCPLWTDAQPSSAPAPGVTSTDPTPSPADTAPLQSPAEANSAPAPSNTPLAAPSVGSPSPQAEAPSPATDDFSPPAPPPPPISPLSPSSSPPSPSPSPPSPSPSFVPFGAASASNTSKSSGLSGGQKAGIAFGVIIGAAAIATITFVLIKRKRNISRTQYRGGRQRERF